MGFISFGGYIFVWWGIKPPKHMLATSLLLSPPPNYTSTRTISDVQLLFTILQYSAKTDCIVYRLEGSYRRRPVLSSTVEVSLERRLLSVLPRRTRPPERQGRW